MQHPIYTIGYGGMTAQKVLTVTVNLDAVLADIRFAARSRIPEWNKGRLLELFGGNYLHLNSLGNVLYKSGGMQIADYEKGKATLVNLHQPVVLMCACADASECHRTVVSNMLKADGFTVEELDRARVKELLLPPGDLANVQLNLFQAAPATSLPFGVGSNSRTGGTECGGASDNGKG